MPKMKTKRASAKRFKLTATGKIKHQKSHLRHLLEHKSSGLKRGKRGAAYVHQSHVGLILRTLPYHQ